LGRLTVVKTLALSKLTSLFLTIPNPSTNLIKDLQKMFFKFIWNDGPDKISRVTITQDVCNGGLRAVDVKKFIQALKVTWIRRLMQSNSKYSYLVSEICPFFQNCGKYGVEYIAREKKNVKNVFWTDVWDGYCAYVNSIPVNNWEQFLMQPVWLNPLFKVAGRPFEYKNYLRKGILFVNDFINDLGMFFTFAEFQRIFNVNTNFLQFEGILRSIKKIFSQPGLTNKDYKIQNPLMQISLNILTKDRKGSRSIYDVMVITQLQPKPQLKWQNNFPDVYFNWKTLYSLPFKVTKDPKLRWLQYRINHRILGTNTLLKKMNIRDNENCSFCNNFPETLCHLFWDCNIVKHFVMEVHQWLMSSIPNLNFELSKKTFLFGCPQFNIPCNNIILLLKYYIYRCKMAGVFLNLNAFQNHVKSLIVTEKFVAIQLVKLDTFTKVWQDFIRLS